MSDAPRLVALMPMRHESERVPGKNHRPFGDGRPLFHHALETLTRCPSVEAIAVDTDSPTIKQQCAESFPDVIVLDRPQELAAGDVPMNEVLLHDASRVDAELYLQTHATNPLLRSETVERAIGTFLDRRPERDSLFAVTRLQTRLWDAEGAAVNHDPEVLLRTQDLPPLFEENSCLYLFEAATLRETRNRIGRRPQMFEIDALEAIDIDEEIDFEIAELVFERRRDG